VAEGLLDRSGGIRGLCRLIDEHAEAIESDLLLAGWRLSDVTVTFSWHDLLVMVRRWMATPGSATAAAVAGHVVWSDQEHLLAALIDAVQIGNWQRVGKKSVPRPKPVPRPGAKSRGRKFGSDPIPISKFHAWWNKDAKPKKRGG
jgi:hypothetical protein